MASISKYKGKHGDTYRAIQFVGVDRKRRSIRLGSLPAKDVDDIRQRIDLLEIYRKSGRAPDSETASWLCRIGDDIHATLAAGGLVDGRAGATTDGVTLGVFLDEYLESRQALVTAGKISADTLRIECVTRDCLVQKFGGDKPLASFTEGDAEDFRNYLLTIGGQPAKRCGSEMVIRARRPLAEATTRKRCSIACKFFGYGVRRELVKRNPFDTAAVPKANIATQHTAYIKADDARAVLEQLPSTEWKLLFALCRWGGLRIGEPRLLTWADVLVDEQKLLVHCEKTEHLIGHETRLVPIFPELAKLIDQRYEETAVGEVYVLPFLQGRSNASLRKTVERAIQRAGVTPWRRLWHNLRGTRQNELLEAGFKRKAVCSWLGNSAEVASDHYEKATEADHQRAIAPLAAPPTEKAAETA